MSYTTLEQAKREASEHDAKRNPIASSMTLRDYFAAKALQGLLAGTLKSSDTSLIARDCYAMADAMLKAREA